jgi:hypothetical protein
VDLNADSPALGNQHLKEANSEEQLTQVLNTVDGTRAGFNEDALTRGVDLSPAIYEETPEARYHRLLHQPCPFRPAGEHARHGAGGACLYCGIGPSEYFDGVEVKRLDEVFA